MCKYAYIFILRICRIETSDLSLQVFELNSVNSYKFLLNLNLNVWVKMNHLVLQHSDI